MFASIIRGWHEMSTYRKIRRIFMIGLAIFGLWALTPYLYNRRVDEPFPAAAPAGQVPAAPTAMMADQSGAMADKTAPTAAPAPAGPIALTSGTFIAGSTPGDSAAGKATIYQLEAGKPLLRLEDFSTTNGPDLFVVLSSSASPEQDGLKNTTYLQLDALKGNVGNQNYELPADIDLDAYKSVVIWCRTFNVVFGYAPLQGAS